jgi:hypothetical protein
MKYFFHDIESNKRVRIDVAEGVTCKKIKQILEDKFQLDTGSFKIEENESKADYEKRICLEYGGSDLKDEWV